jgi:hypothetical protein
MVSRLAAIVAGVALGTAPATASLATEEAVRTNPRPAPLRVAIAIEQEQRLPLPPEFGEHAASRALAQGVREACLPAEAPASMTPPGCTEIGDAPRSRVCVDETLTRALTQEIECAASDARAAAIDLSAAVCQTSDCLRSEARRLGASHLLLLAGTWQDGFAVEGSLTSLQDGRVAPVGPGATYNPQRPRTGPQVLAIIKWVAREAVVGELRRARAAQLADDHGVAATPNPSVASPSPIGLSTPVSPTSGQCSHKALGWTLLAGGATAGVASAWLFAIDKSDVGCAPIAGDPEPCSKVRRTLVPAVGIGIGAAAALVVGAVLLFGGDDGGFGAVSIAAGPNALGIGGRF